MINLIEPPIFNYRDREKEPYTHAARERSLLPPFVCPFVWLDEKLPALARSSLPIGLAN